MTALLKYDTWLETSPLIIKIFVTPIRDRILLHQNGVMVGSTLSGTDYHNNSNDI